MAAGHSSMGAANGWRGRGRWADGGRDFFSPESSAAAAVVAVAAAAAGAALVAEAEAMAVEEDLEGRAAASFITMTGPGGRNLETAQRRRRLR